jgi:hypothetical protein
MPLGNLCPCKSSRSTSLLVPGLWEGITGACGDILGVSMAELLDALCGVFKRVWRRGVRRSGDVFRGLPVKSPGCRC